MIAPTELEQRIRSELKDVSHLEIRDLTGTQDHYEAVVVSGAFAGLNRVEQHQLVYKVLADWMAGPIHALALQTYTPETWSKKLGA